MTVKGEGHRSLGLRMGDIRPSFAAGMISALILSAAAYFILKGAGIYALQVTEYAEGFDSFFRSLGSGIRFENEAGAAFILAERGNAELLKFFLFSVFIIGLGEELFWRALLQKNACKYLGKTPGMILVSLLFGMAHFYLILMLGSVRGLLLIGLIAAAGFAWGYMYERTANIWAPAVSHGVTAFIVWRFVVFR
jgi:membrane protease YdiL (CAAX protease family)